MTNKASNKLSNSAELQTVGNSTAVGDPAAVEEQSPSSILIKILSLSRLEAIDELAKFKKAIGAAGFRSVIKSIPLLLKPILSDLNSTEVNRRKIPSYERFRIGDRVRVRSSVRTTRQINRGRLRQPQSKRRVLARRIGQCKQPIGWAIGRGSKRLFYISRFNIDRTLKSSPICPYPSLLGLVLTVSEFVPPMVHCLRSSGSNAPMLLAEDLEIAIPLIPLNNGYLSIINYGEMPQNRACAKPKLRGF